MAQIAFLTLFLGLTLGPQPVELTVIGPVAAVELLLDGAPAGRIAGPPWRGEIDFGSVLVPHELVARAVDAEGKEIGRAQQWINLPRPPAEVDILLEAGVAGQPVAARLAWQSLTGEKPSAIGVTFDDKPLIVEADGRVRLPPWDPAAIHVLSAELRFSGALTARRDVVFGGRYGDQVATELTSVPVRLRPGKAMPAPERMQGWFLSGGRPLSVAAVDDGPAQLLVVRDQEARGALESLVAKRSGSRSFTFDGQRAPEAYKNDPEYRRSHLTLGEEDTVRFIWPIARTVTGAAQPVALFPPSRDFDAGDGGLLWFLARFVPQVQETSAQRLADAVAVAGLHTLSANRRRAVLLVLSQIPTDASNSTPAMVRRYLEAIRVPLFVWTLGSPEAPMAKAWGRAENVSSFGRMRKAFSRLEQELASQRIVWIDGRHLPQAIELSAEAAAVFELVR